MGTLHALLNIGILVVYGFNVGLRLGPALDVSRTPVSLLLLSVAGVILLTMSNFFGGRLVYDFGVGPRLTGQDH